MSSAHPAESRLASRRRLAHLVIVFVTLLAALAVAFFFIRAAVGKLTGDPVELAPFIEYGWPLWMATATAIAEVVGSVALVIPGTRRYGGPLLFVVMCGAAFTNIANGHPDYVWLNVALGVVSLLLAGVELLTASRKRARRLALKRDDIATE